MCVCVCVCVRGHNWLCDYHEAPEGCLLHNFLPSTSETSGNDWLLHKLHTRTDTLTQEVVLKNKIKKEKEKKKVRA